MAMVMRCGCAGGLDDHGKDQAHQDSQYGILYIPHQIDKGLVGSQWL